MIYFHEEILDELTCPRCKQLFVDPRITPCYKTMCINCVEELKTTSNEMECFFCHQIHHIPEETGLTVNDHLSKILHKKPRRIYRGEAIEQLKISLDKLTHLTNELEFNLRNSALTVTEHCSHVRNQIDWFAEEKINEINTLRNEYISKINDYERECVENMEKKLEIFELNINESRDFIKRSKSYLIEDDVNDHTVKQKHSDALKLEDYMQKKLASLKCIQFNGHQLSFEPNLLLNMKKDFGDLNNAALIDYESMHFYKSQLLYFRCVFCEFFLQ